MSVYKGNAQLQLDNVGSKRWFALRTEDAVGISNGDKAGWQLAPGASVTLHFETGTSGATPPGAVDAALELRVYYETGTGTLVRTLYSGTTAPADGSTYAFFGTSDGTAGGSPRAGTLRLYIRAQRTAIVAYDRNSDGTGGSGGTADITDQGVLQVGCNVDDIAVQAYPAGATFAYTQAGEAVTVTATHTQRFADTNVETVAIDALDGVAVQTTGSSVEVGAGTTAQNFTVNDTNFDAASKSYGAEFRVVGNSGLTPTSGAIPWTYLLDNGANVEANGLKMRRQSFYNVDPRFTLRNGAGSNGYHFQKGLPLAFESTAHDAGYQMLASDLGHAASQVVNARSEAVNGLGYTLTSTSVTNGAVTSISGTTALSDGLNGMTALVEVCPNGKPGGNFGLLLDITSPAGADDPAYITNPSGTILVLADDPSLGLRVESGDPATPDDHWRIGLQMVVGMAASRRTKVNGVVGKTRLAIDSGTGKFLVGSFNAALARLETLASDGITWEYTTTPHLFATAVSPGDALLNLYTFSAATTAQWGANRGGYFVDGGAEIGGVYKGGGGKVDSLGIANMHSSPLTGLKIGPFFDRR